MMETVQKRLRVHLLKALTLSKALTTRKTQP
nr:MAG TPA: hypothetical protein [Caudoviricetes sp.]